MRTLFIGELVSQLEVTRRFDTRVVTRLLNYVTKLGPVGVALRDASMDEVTRARTASVVRAAFEPYIQNETARFKMACWLVSAPA